MNEQVTPAEAVRFLTELAALAASFVVAARVAGLVPGVIAVVAFVVVWGRWFAPKSGRRLADPARLVAEVCLFGGLGVLLVVVGHAVFGILLGVIGVSDAFVVRRVAAAS